MAVLNATGFSQSVARAFAIAGTGLLSRPAAFVGTVADLYDPESPEVRVLFEHAGDELLAPLADVASTGTWEALGSAAARVERWLRDECHVPARESRVVAWGIARGIAAHRNMLYPVSDPYFESQGSWASGVEPRPDISAYEWAELKTLARIIEAAGSDEEGLRIAGNYNLVDSSCRLQGETKPFLLADGTETSVRIVAFRHDELATGGKAGITFEFADVPVAHTMNDWWVLEAPGWERSGMRAWLNARFSELLPKSLVACVEPVRKWTSGVGEVEGGGGVSPIAKATETIDRFWLPCFAEVYGAQTNQRWNVPRIPAIYEDEGRQYRLYKDQGASVSNPSFCKKAGVGSWWWLHEPDGHFSEYARWFLRSPDANGLRCSLLVDSYGDWMFGGITSEGGVSPAFCF